MGNFEVETILTMGFNEQTEKRPRAVSLGKLAVDIPDHTMELCMLFRELSS